MKSDTRVAYAEIEEILRYMPKVYVDKIPKKLREFFYQEKDEKHNFKYDSSKKLNHQNINKKTKTLLAILKLNYWCVSEEERKKWKDKFIKNEENYQKYLSEKYNTDDLFKKDMNDIKDNAQNMELIEYKQKGILVKILDTIKKFFKNV